MYFSFWPLCCLFFFYIRILIAHLVSSNSWPTPRNWQWGAVKNETLRHKRLFQFPHCELSIYVQLHSSSTCIWSIYLSVDTIFQSLCFLSGFPWWRVAANKEATEPRVPLGYVEVITPKVLRSPPWLGWPIWNICITNDHGYVPLVVNTSRSFPHSWLITGFVTRLTRRVSLVEQELFTLQEHLSSPLVFSWVPVARSLVVCVCFVYRCLVFCTFSIYGFWLPLWYLQTVLKTAMAKQRHTSCISEEGGWWIPQVFYKCGTELHFWHSYY